MGYELNLVSTLSTKEERVISLQSIKDTFIIQSSSKYTFNNVKGYVRNIKKRESFRNKVKFTFRDRHITCPIKMDNRGRILIEIINPHMQINKEVLEGIFCEALKAEPARKEIMFSSN